MKINELQQLNSAKSQFSQIQKMYFFKSRELLDLEEHLKISKLQIQELQKNSRAKLKNSKYKYINRIEKNLSNIIGVYAKICTYFFYGYFLMLEFSLGFSYFPQDSSAMPDTVISNCLNVISVHN